MWGRCRLTSPKHKQYADLRVYRETLSLHKKDTKILFITFALKMPEGYVLIAVYLFIYLFICMRVIRKTQKVLNRIA